MNDIVIIGGGIAGLSAAARLSHHASVILLESEDTLGYHASSRSAAVFIEDYGNTAVRSLNSASTTYLHTENAGVLSPRGMLVVAKADDNDLFKSEYKSFGMAEISVEDARGKIPILDPNIVRYAAFRNDIYDLDTDLLLQNFRREAWANGATNVTGASVIALSHTSGRWDIVTGDHIYHADVVVNAAGAWVDQVAAMAGIPPVGIIPFRRSMARIPAPDGMDVSQWPMMDEVGEAWYAKPDAGHLLVSPAEEHATHPHDAWADDMVLAEGLARYEKMVTTPVTQVYANWAGLRSFAPDRALVIGHAPQQPAFFWLAGQGGYGFQTCVAASQLTADLIIGRQPELPPDTVKALSPDRFCK
ncbi:MAG: FAD-binding oxidoreductase [Paracoccaceae bacterium]|nr:FAD-binding oxidoreductase [Paracoccaceae bacterium]